MFFVVCQHIWVRFGRTLHDSRIFHGFGGFAEWRRVWRRYDHRRDNTALTKAAQFGNTFLMGNYATVWLFWEGRVADFALYARAVATAWDHAAEEVGGAPTRKALDGHRFSMCGSNLLRQCGLWAVAGLRAEAALALSKIGLNEHGSECMVRMVDHWVANPLTQMWMPDDAAAVRRLFWTFDYAECWECCSQSEAATKHMRSMLRGGAAGVPCGPEVIARLNLTCRETYCLESSMISARAARLAEVLGEHELAERYAQQALARGGHELRISQIHALRGRNAARNGDRAAAVRCWQQAATVAMGGRWHLYALLIGWECGAAEGRAMTDAACAAMGRAESEVRRELEDAGAAIPQVAQASDLQATIVEMHHSPRWKVRRERQAERQRKEAERQEREREQQKRDEERQAEHAAALQRQEEGFAATLSELKATIAELTSGGGRDAGVAQVASNGRATTEHSASVNGQAGRSEAPPHHPLPRHRSGRAPPPIVMGAAEGRSWMHDAADVDDALARRLRRAKDLLDTGLITPHMFEQVRQPVLDCFVTMPQTLPQHVAQASPHLALQPHVPTALPYLQSRYAPQPPPLPPQPAARQHSQSPTQWWMGRADPAAAFPSRRLGFAHSAIGPGSPLAPAALHMSELPPTPPERGQPLPGHLHQHSSPFAAGTPQQTPSLQTPSLRSAVQPVDSPPPPSVGPIGYEGHGHASSPPKAPWASQRGEERSGRANGGEGAPRGHLSASMDLLATLDARIADLRQLDTPGFG